MIRLFGHYYKNFCVSIDMIFRITCIKIIVLLLISCGETERSEELRYGLTEYASVTDSLYLDNSELLENDLPIISAISTVATDPSNNIYLVDPRTLKVHSFTENLNYRWTAGGRGSGPGQFEMISSIHADDEYVYVYDFPSSTVTRLSTDGDRLDEWSFGEGGHRIHFISRLNSGEFITTGWRDDTQTAVNLYSEDFRERTGSFIGKDRVFITDHENIERQVFQNFPGTILPVHDDLLLYAPKIYSGKILKIVPDHSGEWDGKNWLPGYEEIDEPVRLHLSADGDHERSHLSGFNPAGGYFHTEFLSLSHGLFELENGQIAHLSTRLNDDDMWDLVIEQFDKVSLDLHDVIVVENFIPSQQPQQLPLWMDKSGRIYVTENSDKPLRVLTVE